jgi:chemotaxis signal transduction protein
MSAVTELESQSYVLLRLGDRRFALRAECIGELVTPSRIIRFPNQTPEVDGVILRRGRIVPVCDVTETLTGHKLTSLRFYLLSLRHYGAHTETVALPVTGECELIAAEITPASGDHPAHVEGWISYDGEVIEVLNLDHLTPGPGPEAKELAHAAAQESRP